MNMKITALAAAVGALAMAGAGGADARSTHTTQISFDGYCDGMQITVFPWHQAGTKVTGCRADVGAGMEGRLKGASWGGKTLTIGNNDPNYAGGIVLYNIQYPLVNGGGWSLYESDDGVKFTFIHSGTYTLGTPRIVSRRVV